MTVFERTGRCGGWIHSKRTEQGAVLETGPCSMRPAERPGKTGLWLVSSVCVFVGMNYLWCYLLIRTSCNKFLSH